METEELIKVALSGKHTEFDRILTIDGYSAARTYKRASKKLMNAFKTDSDAFLEKYIEEMENGIDDLHMIFQHKLLNTCAKFYEEEMRIVTLVMAEYESYLMSGHLIRALLGEERSDE